MGKLATITRRTFLFGSVAIAGGAAFGYWKYKQPYDNPLMSDLGDDQAALTPYVIVSNDGIKVIAARAEMGQGTYTSLAALVAEELKVELSDVEVIHGPTSKAYFNAAVMEEAVPFAQTDDSSLARNVREFTKVPAKFLGMQITGGSSSIADGFDKMRLAGAVARDTLIEAAARRWQVSAETLRAQNGTVVDASGKAIAYTELTDELADIELNHEPQLTPQAEWRILGKSQPRVDMLGKVTGTAEFGVDVELENMLYATVRMNPNLGGEMISFDADKAEKMRGVDSVFALDNGIAVVASNTWYAFNAAKKVDVKWAESSSAKNTEDLLKLVKDSFKDEHKDSRFRDEGDCVGACSAAADLVSAEYQVPYLAHAAMEPLNATALLKDGRLDIWAGNQWPTLARSKAAEITGLDEEDIHVHTLLMGGGFGRRLEPAYIEQAVKIAKRYEGKPIKLTWSREEDTTHDHYRPMAVARFDAVMGDKVPEAIDLHTASPSVAASQMGERAGIPAMGPDPAIAQSAWDQPYSVPHYRVTGYRTPAAIPVSSWRSVGASQNGFFHESMLDELAHSKSVDPMQMRLDMIDHMPSRKVLEAVAEMSNWGSPMPAGHGRGVAYCLSFGVPVAEVIEVADTERGIKILKAFAAVDVGIAMDPRNIEAQVFGGLNFGLAAAMMGEITFENGAAQQSNFHNYNSIRMNQSPDFDIRILENGDRVKGIGEPATPPAAPALANAIFAATGKRIRELPMNKHVRFA